MTVNLQIQIDENDENVFSFSEFELVIHPSGNYILSEEGVFDIKGLESFLEFDDQYVITNEFDKLFITAEDFEKIKMIYLKYA
jgi:hypothetical protein